MRQLLTPRWFGLLCLTVAASAIMILLGRWQWDRYEQRNAINARIDASATADPVPFAPRTPEWTLVSLTGQYDGHLEILARNRTVDGRPGFEILTPLLLDDGTAVLIDRGWVPPHPDGPTVEPSFPPAPTGTVTVTGRVRAAETDARAELRDGRWQVRRIGIEELTTKLPYRLAPVYVLADDASTDLVPVPADRENDWLNLGYAVQWWIFAAGAFVGLFWLARRELRTSPAENPATPDS